MHGKVMMPIAVKSEGLKGVSIIKLPNLTVAAPALAKASFDLARKVSLGFVLLLDTCLLLMLLES